MRTVVITHFALSQINSIFEYYSLFVTIRVAKKIKSEIIASIKSLKQEKVEWQKDEYLEYLNKDHKRLICGNYKIIYYYDQIKNIVYVTDVFDSRQDPIKEKG
jgi:toxin ParE1/3/4